MAGPVLLRHTTGRMPWRGAARFHCGARAHTRRTNWRQLRSTHAVHSSERTLVCCAWQATGIPHQLRFPYPSLPRTLHYAHCLWFDSGLSVHRAGSHHYCHCTAAPFPSYLRRMLRVRRHRLHRRQRAPVPPTGSHTPAWPHCYRAATLPFAKGETALLRSLDVWRARGAAPPTVVHLRTTAPAGFTANSGSATDLRFLATGEQAVRASRPTPRCGCGKGRLNIYTLQTRCGQRRARQLVIPHQNSAGRLRPRRLYGEKRPQRGLGSYSLRLVFNKSLTASGFPLRLLPFPFSPVWSYARAARDHWISCLPA